MAISVPNLLPDRGSGVALASRHAKLAAPRERPALRGQAKFSGRIGSDTPWIRRTEDRASDPSRGAR